MKQRQHQDFERFWYGHDLPIATKTEWAWVKGNDADAPAPPASSENVGEKGWKAFEDLKIEWCPSQDQGRLVILNRTYFTEKMVNQDIRRQTRGQSWMGDGEVIKKARMEYKDASSGVCGLVMVSKAVMDGLAKIGTDGKGVQTLSQDGKVQDIPDDLRRRLRPIEDVCPLITSEEIVSQGMLVCLKSYQAKEQYAMDDHWCDTRICRLCNCIGKNKFRDREHEQVHRYSNEHNIALKNYTTKHLRCLLYNFDAWEEKSSSTI